MKIPFYKPFLTGKEKKYIEQVLGSDHLCGDGPFTKKCNSWLEKRRDSGRFLARTKLILGEWARREGLVLVDAGASERFDCKTTEFIDPHHALPACYNKIFGRFWKDYFSASGIKPGLYAG